MRKVANSCMLAVLLTLLAGPVAQATPTPPYLLVNHATQECAERWIGDDCRWCDPLPGWEVVGLASSTQCPEGYALLDYVEMACQPYKSEFCCWGGAHRGDCDDLVLHDGYAPLSTRSKAASFPTVGGRSPLRWNHPAGSVRTTTTGSPVSFAALPINREKSLGRQRPAQPKRYHRTRPWRPKGRWKLWRRSPPPVLPLPDWHRARWCFWASWL